MIVFKLFNLNDAANLITIFTMLWFLVNLCLPFVFCEMSTLLTTSANGSLTSDNKTRNNTFATEGTERPGCDDMLSLLSFPQLAALLSPPSSTRCLPSS